MQRFGGIQHHTVTLAQGGIRLFTFSGFAVEGLVNRLAECVPQLLLLTAVDRHAMGLGLPALLQRLDRVNAQLGLCAQRFGFFNHGVAQGQALLLQGFQWLGRIADGGFPQRLQLGKRLFAHMAALAPAVAKLVQDAVETLPVVVQRGAVRRGPGVDFFNQSQTVRAVLGGLGLDLLQPHFHNFVGFVASLIKALPQRMVGHATLVGLFPLVTQGAQAFLHLAPANGLAVRALEQALGLGYQFFAQLVGAPALPAFQLAGRRQGGVGLVFQLVVNDLAKLFERIAQGSGRTGAGLAVAFSHFLFHFGQGIAHRRGGLGLDFRVHLLFLRLGSGFQRNATHHAQFVCPHGHGGQRRRRICRRSNGLGQRGLECVPHHQQLGA